MSTITKEWLQQKIADMEARRDDPWLGLDEDTSNTLAALRIALASLKAEPIGFAFADDVDLMRKKIKVGGMLTVRHQGEVALYTAPPARVSVPDENGLLPCPCCGGKSEFDYDDDNLNWISCNVCGISTDTAYHTDVDAKEKLREVWNRRAAILQGAYGNTLVIPDGWADMLQRWLVFGRGMQNAGSQLPRNLIAETESVLAAAPQQEVK